MIREVFVYPQVVYIVANYVPPEVIVHSANHLCTESAVSLATHNTQDHPSTNTHLHTHVVIDMWCDRHISSIPTNTQEHQHVEEAIWSVEILHALTA